MAPFFHSFLGGYPTKNGLPKKGSLFLPGSLTVGRRGLAGFGGCVAASRAPAQRRAAAGVWGGARRGWELGPGGRPFPCLGGSQPSP